MRLAINLNRVSWSLTALLLLSLSLTLALSEFSPALAAANLNATNSPQVSGSVVTFSGGGFGSGESASAWTTAPNGDVLAVVATKADSAGKVSYSLNTLGYNSGVWALTLHGLTSGSEAIAPFELVTGLPSTPGPSPTPEPTDPGTTPKGTLEVAPDVVRAGQSVELRGTGFAANEFVFVWDTAPNGATSTLKTVYSDSNGLFAYTYSTKGPSGGLWAITASGRTSGVQKVGYVRVLPNTAGSASISLSPDSGNSATLIQGRGINYLPGEQFSYWATAPDGRVYSAGQGYADLSGAFNFTYLIPSVQPGRWAITARGNTSKLEATAFFNYSS